jgi:hypothetical protein
MSPAVLMEPAHLPEGSPEGTEVVQSGLDRFGHEIEGDVVDGSEQIAVHGPGGATGGGGDPALAEGHAREGVLLGHVVELVPGQVRAVVTGR